MRKLVLAFGILAGVVSVGSAMSEEEIERAGDDCLDGDKNVCQALINIGLKSVEKCKDDCILIGAVYVRAERYREAIPYLKKAIALGDRIYGMLALTYDKLQDYYNAKKYYEIGCDKDSWNQAESCYSLGDMYYEGRGVRQDYAKVVELWKKACDMKFSGGCGMLGFLYEDGLGVRQNLSTAKQYFGKACDLGEQVGCDNYKLLNSQGVR